MTNSKKRERDEPVDWEQFFGGRPPKEIIVIDDDEEAAESRQKQSQPVMPAAQVSQTQINGAVAHTDKRRKTTASTAYDPVYSQHNAYSNTHTPYYDESPRNYTGSTDRTASYNTTAPTSLGSASSGTYVEDTAVGQKRKRTTRQAAAETKRREVEFHADPYADYIPPPRPPIKAKDVAVMVVPDVC